MIRSSGTLASAGALAFTNVDIPSDIDLSRRVDEKPKVRLNHGSEMLLAALRSDGRPPRKTWDATGALSATSNSLFRLKAVELPDISCKGTSGTEYRKDFVFEHLKSQLQTGTGDAEGDALKAASAVPPAGKPQKRSEKYYNLLMKHYDKRVDSWTNEDEDEARGKAEFAARHFDRTAKQRLNQTQRPAQNSRTTTVGSRSSSDGEDEGEEDPQQEAPPEDCFLQAWDGQMQVDLEIVVLPAPGVEEDEDKDSAEASTPSSSGGFSAESRGSSKSSRRMASKSSKGKRLSSSSSSSRPGSGSIGRADLYEELEQLKEEMGVDEDDKASEDSDDMPEGLKLKRLQNVWDNPNPRWCLGIGGTVFFVPDAERYAMGSSLPPPPPPSLHGRRRIHLKPRLPLEISNHRYRDERPNIWPDAPYSPEVQDYLRFEEKLMTLDFYKSCNSALTQLPQMEKASDEKKHRAKFGAMVEQETHRSVAWKSWRHREKLKKKEAAQKAKEQEEAAAEQAREAAKAAAEAAAAAAAASM